MEIKVKAKFNLDNPFDLKDVKRRIKLYFRTLGRKFKFKNIEVKFVENKKKMTRKCIYCKGKIEKLKKRRVGGQRRRLFCEKCIKKVSLRKRFASLVKHNKLKIK